MAVPLVGVPRHHVIYSPMRLQRSRVRMPPTENELTPSPGSRRKACELTARLNLLATPAQASPATEAKSQEPELKLEYGQEQEQERVIRQTKG